MSNETETNSDHSKVKHGMNSIEHAEHAIEVEMDWNRDYSDYDYSDYS